MGACQDKEKNCGKEVFEILRMQFYFAKFATDKDNYYFVVYKYRAMKKRTCAWFFGVFLLLLPALRTEAQNAVPDLSLDCVVIDPGHGGKDPGTVSIDRKTYEKTLTLAISKKLAERIRKAYPSVKVYLTREDDRFIELSERARFASAKDAKLFISIHINATKSRTANGFSAYILGQSSDKNKDTYAFNMEVLKRENSVIYMENDTTKYQTFDASPESQILMQLMSNAYREQSLLLAQLLNDGMKTPFKRNIGVYQGNFAVLRLASMPAVLVEAGFLSNSEDLAVLRSEKSLELIADNLFAAFKEYKTRYDASVSVGEALQAPAEITQESPEEAPTLVEETPVQPVQTAQQAEEAAPEAAQPAADAVRYGAQVLASSRLMKESDPYFQGFRVTTVKAGNLYKYILEVTEELPAARTSLGEVKKKFKDAFLVEIRGDQVKLYK